MPYTPKQQRFFHEAAEHPDVAREHGISRDEAGKLADEADRLAREGKTKKASILDLTPVFGPRRVP